MRRGKFEPNDRGAFAGIKRPAEWAIADALFSCASNMTRVKLCWLGSSYSPSSQAYTNVAAEANLAAE